MQIETVIRDTREQLPYEFEQYPVQIEDATLKTGDYTCPQLCDWDEDNETYIPNFAVERKTGDDFLQSITRHRSRFQDEIERAEDWELPLLVVIEEVWTVFTRNLGVMEPRNITPSQVKGTVDAWGEHHNVDFFFAGSREYAERHTFETLLGKVQAEEYSV